MDAKTLYRQGVIAIRDQKDLAQGRELLLQSLKQDPNNDMAWLWLTRTVKDRQKRLECIERALRINPQNEQALQLKEHLLAGPPSPESAPPTAAPVTPPFILDAAPAVPASTASAAAPVPAAPPPTALQPLAARKGGVIRPLGPKTVDVQVTPQEKDQIDQLMQRADLYMEAGDTEQAVSQWVEVLKIRVDHELALRNAAGNLWKLSYWDDARELVQRALDANTQVPSIYLTAIDMAERQNDHDRAESIREKIASLPNADEQLLVTVADYYLSRYQTDQAITFLERAVESHPDSQKLLVKTGDVLQQMERKQEAMTYYDRAVRHGSRTKAGKEADKKLAGYVPVLTDRERGSFLLAARETVGLSLFYLLVGWQDAGLSLIDMGPRRWAGVFLSLVGGYLLITATSSPQQQPIAGWLGGKVPEALPSDPQPNPQPANPFSRPGRALEDPTSLPIIPESARWFLAMVGAAILIAAFTLVFYHTLHIITSGPLPYLH